MRVVIVNEFSDVNCPVTKLVYEFGGELSKIEKTTVVQGNLRTKYRPGGTRWQRVLSLFIIHFLMPFVIGFQWLIAKLHGERFCVLVTTLPPLLHWNLLILSKILRYRCVVWYQDAHPEIEARILHKKGFQRIASFLATIDRLILSLADHMVVLDDAMADLVASDRGMPIQKISVAPPWTAFVSPAKIIREPKMASNQPLRLLYAGNYGFAHDLKPFAMKLECLNADEKKRIVVTGVGMNEVSRAAFEAVFNHAGVKVETLPRVESFSKLLELFHNADLGIVSLRDDYAGIAAPSKAYTYVSQGLPILYSGPKHTLPARLVEAGQGYSDSDFIQMIRSQTVSPLNFSGKTSIDPKVLSTETLVKAVYDRI